MTPKDYRTIAACIKEERQNLRLDSGSSERTLYSLVVRLMVECAKQNPRFNRAKFEKACGYE